MVKIRLPNGRTLFIEGKMKPVSLPSRSPIKLKNKKTGKIIELKPKDMRTDAVKNKPKTPNRTYKGKLA